MKHLSEFLMTGAVLLTPLACQSEQARAAPERVHTVVIDKMKFGPVPASIRAGDVILWVNRDVVPHTATARDRSFNVILRPRSQARSVIGRAGLVPFYCVYHPGMKGQLKVAR